MGILFLSGAFLFIRNKIIIIGFSSVNIVFFTYLLFNEDLLTNVNDNNYWIWKIIFLCYTIFWITTLFSIPEYIGNTFCRTFGYSYY